MRVLKALLAILLAVLFYSAEAYYLTTYHPFSPSFRETVYPNICSTGKAARRAEARGDLYQIRVCR